MEYTQEQLSRYKEHFGGAYEEGCVVCDMMMAGLIKFDREGEAMEQKTETKKVRVDAVVSIWTEIEVTEGESLEEGVYKWAKYDAPGNLFVEKVIEVVEEEDPILVGETSAGKVQ